MDRNDEVVEKSRIEMSLRITDDERMNVADITRCEIE
jgi:hypothetical protein